jgi:hypothetical protein
MSNMLRTASPCVVLITYLLLNAAAASAQGTGAATTPKEPDNYSTWVRREVNKALAAQKAIAENGNGIANQTESPSVDQTATSLVDTSSTSDFVSLALNLTGLRPAAAGEEKPKSGSVTATLYSLVAAAKGASLTDPALYKRGTNWRRLAFILGTEESKLADHFTDKPSTNVGFKLLIINGRDVYSRNAQTQLGLADSALVEYQTLELTITNPLQCLIFRAVTGTMKPGATPTDCRKDDAAFLAFLKKSPFDDTNWPTTRKALEQNKEAMKQVDQLMATLAMGKAVATEKITNAVEHIQRGQQLSVAYFTKQREDDGTDEHRAELIFDYGLSRRLNWTLNASLDFRDRKLSDDTKSGRFATEFQAKLSNPGTQVWSAKPVTLSGSTEITKDPDTDVLIRAQAKLVVPLTTGVEVPIAYTYANRDAEGITSGSQLKFSLAVDPVRLRERFR